jgi:hypothetical protein
MRLLAVLALSVLSGLPAMHAQRAPAGQGSARPVYGISFGPVPSPRTIPPTHFFPPAFFLGSPWLADYQPVSTQPVAPTVIVVQTQAPTLVPKEDPKPITSLLIERRGDHFVRLGSGNELRQSETAVLPGSSEDLRPSTRAARLKPRQLPTILIFRDGREEEVGAYTIADGIFYASGDYWTDGYWQRPIPLSQLDLPKSLKTNQERGGNLILPAAANQVIVGP